MAQFQQLFFEILGRSASSYGACGSANRQEGLSRPEGLAPGAVLEVALRKRGDISGVKQAAFGEVNGWVVYLG